MPVMAAHAPDSMTLQTAMTRDDYARYFAVTNRRRSNTALYAAAFSAAIPAALMFRAIGQRFVIAAPDAELIGKFCLFAFVLGLLAMILAGALARRITIRHFVSGTLNPLEPKTVVLDAAGVTVTGQLSHTHWRWAAISQLTIQSGLILLWIGGRMPFVIPDRGFASPATRDAAIAFIRARLGEAASFPPPRRA